MESTCRVQIPVETAYGDFILMSLGEEHEFITSPPSSLDVGWGLEYADWIFTSTEDAVSMKQSSTTYI